MRKHLASALFALAFVVLFNTASAADHRVKPPVDFTATPMLNGTTTSLGKTGVVVKIQSAAIAKDGTITARATIVDSDGFPLDRLGVATKGPVSMSFIAAYIPAGQTQYVSYTTSVAAATLNNNPSQTQAANDSGGTFATNAIGDYTYTFKTKAPATFDATATHSIGVSAQRNLAEFGTFDEWSETSNDVFNFRSERLGAEGDALRGDHRRLQPVPRPADRPRRIPPQGGTLHHVPHAADHQSGYAAHPGYEGSDPQDPHGIEPAQRQGRHPLPDLASRRMVGLLHRRFPAGRPELHHLSCGRPPPKPTPGKPIPARRHAVPATTM